MERKEKESKLVEGLKMAGIVTAVLGLRSAIEVGNIYQETKKFLGETFLGREYRNANYDGSTASRAIQSIRYKSIN